MGAFRAAIWAAVSTETQAAEDKVSLPAQQEMCRSLLTARAWTEAAGPYVVAGASRTRWVNLRDAELAIPELRLMLDEGQAGRFNLLVLYDFNRLRDLLDPVARTLAAYGCQIFSISQPVEPMPPAEFDPYTSDSSSMMQGMSQIISRAQVSDLRRKYRVAMPKRVKELGLPAISIPYGYAKPPGRETDRKAVPVQVPEEIQVLRMIRDLFLAGHSRDAVAETLTHQGVPTARGGRWHQNTIAQFLSNPFYCGQVVFGRSRARVDPRTGQRRRLRGIPRSQWTIGQGRHEPLWTVDQFEEIQRELVRRRRRNAGLGRQVYQLTSLLRCAACGSTLARFKNGPRSEPDRAIWRCYIGPAHPRASIPETVALQALGLQLRQFLVGLDLPAPRAGQEPRANVLDARKVLASLEARRQRFQRVYGDGLISYEDFAARLQEIEDQAEEARRSLTDVEDHAAVSRRRLERRDRLAAIVDSVPAYLLEAPRSEVNQALRDLFEGIVVDVGRIAKLCPRP